jgi:putative ABC transport system substrate-binding protein
MNKHSLIVLSIIAALLIGSIIFLKKRCATKPAAHGTGFKIGIIQTASHPALDAVRNGFIERVKGQIGNDVEFVINNAQASVNSAHVIAQRYHVDPTIQAIFAIATPAAQAAVQAEQEKPIIIAAVTDPKAAGLLNNNNVTGCSDAISAVDQVMSLLDLLGNNKSVGLLFNTAEINSVTAIQKLHKELKYIGVTTFDAGITSEADIAHAVTAALNKADILFAPTDNTVASAIDLVASLALRAKKPLIVSDTMLLKHGALAAEGIDYHEHGKLAGNIILQVLVDKKAPSCLPIEYSDVHLMINKKIADQLGITIPNYVEGKVTIVE